MEVELNNWKWLGGLGRLEGDILYIVGLRGRGFGVLSLEGVFVGF